MSERFGLDQNAIIDMIQHQGFSEVEVQEYAESLGLTPEQKRTLHKEVGLSGVLLDTIKKDHGKIQILYNDDNRHVVVVRVKPKFKHLVIATKRDANQGPEFWQSLFLENVVWKSVKDLEDEDMICFVALYRQVMEFARGSVGKV